MYSRNLSQDSSSKNRKLTLVRGELLTKHASVKVHKSLIDLQKLLAACYRLMK